MAAKGGGRLEILQKVWDWANEKLTEEINNKFFVATDDKGRAVFHMAAEWAELEIESNE